MNIAGLDAQYVSHVCFIFRSPRGAVVVTDPFFADGFQWQGHYERYLSPPDISTDEIRKCDVILVTHIHGDHFDPAAVERIAGNTGARICAPHDVIAVLRERNPDMDGLSPLEEGMTVEIKDTVLTFYAGYDNSRDELGRSNKFSMLMKVGDNELFYSGDCHEGPPAMAGHSVDAVCAWPHPDNSKLRAFCEALPTKKYVLMHGDRFDPGDFFCNMSYEHEKRRVEKIAPGVQAIIPHRISKVASFD